MKINKLSMAKGYKIMGELNLKIANEYFILENEGENKVYEVVTKKAEGETE